MVSADRAIGRHGKVSDCRLGTDRTQPAGDCSGTSRRKEFGEPAFKAIRIERDA